MADRIRFLCAGILLAGLCLPSALAQAADDADTAPAAAAIPADGNNASDESPEQQNYYIDRSEGEPRFIQRLMWRETVHILRYEVIVEKQEDDGSYRETERVSTEQNFAEFSLTAGRYRYRVDLYDLIDEFASSTAWREFEIIRALQPELTRFSPQAFYLDEDDAWEITLHGKNLLPDSEIYLVQDESKIIPIDRVSEKESFRLTFSWKSLVMGKYYIYVKNPGGLDTRSGPFTIANKKRFDYNISLGYAPIVPLYGYLFRDSNIDAPFTDFIYPLGAAVKVNFFPFKRVWGNLGIEASGSFASLKHKKQSYSAEAFLLNTHLSLLYQKYFSKKTYAVNVGLGLGAATLYDLSYSYPVGDQTEPVSAIIPSVIQEFSFTLFFFKPYFISAGIDYIQTFSADKPMPGFIRFLVLAGIHL